MILLNPGPVNVTPRVRAALAGPDLCHREPEYFDLQDALRERLLDVLGAPSDRYASVLLTGSGTAAVESMIASSVPDGGRLLVVQNGVYGERMASIARAHRIDCDVLECAQTERPDLEALHRSLAAARFDAVAVVHHETTTGLLNDLDAIASLCRSQGVPLLVDAVSSLGGEPFDFASLQPAAVCATANKCIGGLPGLSFVIAGRPFLRAIAEHRARSVYLHLPRHAEAQDRRSTPFTPAIPAAYALLAALEELGEETVPRRVDRFRSASGFVRERLAALGFGLLLPPPLRSSTLTTFTLPRGLGYDRLHDRLKDAGFVIYAGLGAEVASRFRVATMGAVAMEDYRRFVETVAAMI